MLYLDIKMIGVLAAAALLLAPQEKPGPKEVPKISLDKTGDFHALVKELEEITGGPIKLGRGIESKAVSIKVKDAGFYEALDALCRAHKDATYCPEDDDYTDRHDLAVTAAPW